MEMRSKLKGLRWICVWCHLFASFLLTFCYPQHFVSGIELDTFKLWRDFLAVSHLFEMDTKKHRSICHGVLEYGDSCNLRTMLLHGKFDNIITVRIAASVQNGCTERIDAECIII